MLAEMEVTVNSHLITTEKINYVRSLIPLILINLLIMKSKIEMPPTVDLYLQISIAESIGGE